MDRHQLASVSESSEAYLLQYNEIAVAEAFDHDKVKGKYPFDESTWKDNYINHVNVQETHGDLLRSTFLSGGSLHMSHLMYQDSLASKAFDIEHGCILTDTEVTHNCEGVRLFFVLDYSTSLHPLPSFEEVLLHLRLLYTTVHECFPHLENLVMHIATSNPKRRHRKSSGSVDLAWGIHAVFPMVVLTTPTIKLIAQLIDTRISNTFPRWNNIVDPTCYRPSSATLRPCFSYKWVECPICNTGTTSSSSDSAQSTKRRRVDRETMIKNLFEIQLSDYCSCFNGLKVDPSIFTYRGSLIEADGPVTQVVRADVRAVLTEMSITPSRMGTFTEGFCRPVDMGDEHDTIPRPGTLVSENRAFSAFQCRKNSESLELGDYPNGCQTFLDIIKRMNDNYRFLAIQRLCLDKKNRSFMISVKGSGSRYCMYKNGVHNNNLLYFCVDIRRARIQAHCSDPDCKREHGDAPRFERVLTMGEKFKVATQFGLKMSDSQMQRREHVVSLPPRAPLIPPVQMSEKDIKTQRWEEKRRMYQSSMTSDSN